MHVGVLAGALAIHAGTLGGQERPLTTGAFGVGVDGRLEQTVLYQANLAVKPICDVKFLKTNHRRRQQRQTQMTFQDHARIWILTVAFCPVAWASPVAEGARPTAITADMVSLFAEVGMHDRIQLAAHSVESDAVDTILAKAKECLGKVDDLDASHKLLADTFVDQHREQVRARVAELLQRADFVNVVESSMIEHLAADLAPEKRIPC